MINDVIEIRPLKKSELSELIKLCALHAEYENYTYNAEGKSEKLEAAIFNNPPFVYCAVLSVNNKLAGYTTYSKEFSTWEATHYLHMDCLYIVEDQRRKGLGALIMKYVHDEGLKLGVKEIQWQTPYDNFSAIKFYDQIGALRKDKRRYFLPVK